MGVRAAVRPGLKEFYNPKIFQSKRMFENIKIIGPFYIESILRFKVLSKKKWCIYSFYLFIYSH